MTLSGSHAAPARPGLPTLDEVAELGVVLSGTALPEWQDANGHVNVAHHYEFHMETAIAFFETLGLDEAFVHAHRRSTFSVEQHLCYYDEVLVGHEITGHVRLLDVSSKLVHGISVVVNHSTGRIANTVEFVEAHVDLDTRRTTPWGEEIADQLGGIVDRHRELSWTLPTNAGMGLRP